MSGFHPHPKQAEHEHRWRVYGSALCPPTIMVDCSCGASGWVKRFDAKDWGRAYHAPSRPYSLPSHLMVAKVRLAADRRRAGR